MKWESCWKNCTPTRSCPRKRHSALRSCLFDGTPWPPAKEHCSWRKENALASEATAYRLFINQHFPNQPGFPDTVLKGTQHSGSARQDRPPTPLYSTLCRRRGTFCCLLECNSQCSFFCLAAESVEHPFPFQN